MVDKNRYVKIRNEELSGGSHLGLGICYLNLKCLCERVFRLVRQSLFGLETTLTICYVTIVWRCPEWHAALISYDTLCTSSRPLVCRTTDVTWVIPLMIRCSSIAACSVFAPRFSHPQHDHASFLPRSIYLGEKWGRKVYACVHNKMRIYRGRIFPLQQVSQRVKTICE